MRRQCRWRRRPHRRCGRAHSPLYHPLRRIPSSAHPGPRQARLRRASRSHAPLVPPLPHPPPRSPLPPMLTTTPRRRCARPATWPQKPHPAGSPPMDPSPPPLHPPFPPLTQRAASTASCARSGADAPCMSMSKKQTKQKGACGPHTPHYRRARSPPLAPARCAPRSLNCDFAHVRRHRGWCARHGRRAAPWHRCAGGARRSRLATGHRPSPAAAHAGGGLRSLKLRCSPPPQRSVPRLAAPTRSRDCRRVAPAPAAAKRCFRTLTSIPTRAHSFSRSVRGRSRTR